MRFNIPRINFDFIKEEFPLEKGFFLMPEFLLRMNALWPYFAKSPFLLLLNAINSFSLLCTGILIFIAAANIFAVDPLEALDPIGPGMSFTITWLKYMYFWYYKREYKEIIDFCRELFLADKNIENDKAKLKNMTGLTAVAAKLTLMTFVTSIFTDFSFIAKTIIDYLGDRSSHYILFNIYYPYEEDLSGFPYFHMIYASLVYAALMISTTIGAIDGLCVTFSLYFAAMFKTLQYEIQHLFANYKDKNEQKHITLQENLKLNYNLRLAVERQNEIIDLAEKFRELSKWVIFGHFLSASLTICYGGLAFMLAPDIPAKLRYIIYLSCILLELWCYCLGASNLQEESFKVAEAAYFSYWYKTNAETRRLIYIIIMRSQKAVVLNVPFFTPSLPAFSAICRTAGSYMTLLKTFM